MRVLVTGSAGFIGMHVAKRLLLRGDEVVGVDNLNPYYDPQLKRDRLAELRPHPGFRFIKMDAQRLLHAAREGEPRLDLHRFKAALDRNQIDLIVERVESEQLLVELLDYPIDFGQGFLFGEPRLAKAAA